MRITLEDNKGEQTTFENINMLTFKSVVRHLKKYESVEDVEAEEDE